MNIRILLIPLLAMASLSASIAVAAPDDEQRTTNLTPVSSTASKPIRGQRAIELLALETDLTPRLVRSVMTHNPAEYYGFRLEINAARQFQASLGEERYSNLMAGRPIELYSAQVREAVRSRASTSHGQVESVVVAAAD